VDISSRFKKAKENRGNDLRHMKLVMTRWKAEPLKWRGFPDWPVPFSPVQSARKLQLNESDHEKNDKSDKRI